MIEVTAPDGSIVRFDDNTPVATIESAMQQKFGTEEQRQPHTFAQKAASTGADILAGTAGWPGSLINMAREYVPGASSFLQPVPGVQDFRNMLATESGALNIPVAGPESPAGKQIQQAIVGAGTGAAFGGPFGALGGLYSGLSSETAGQLTEGTAVEPYARFFGAMLTPGFTASRNILAQAFGPKSEQAVINQAIQQGPVSVGDVTGGAIKAAEGNLARAPFSGAPLRNLAETQAANISNAADDIASTMASSVPQTARQAGEALQSATRQANRTMDRFSQILYNREVYSKIPRNTAVVPTTAAQAVDDIANTIGNSAVLSTPEWAGLGQVKQILSQPLNMTNLSSVKQLINGYAETASKAGQNQAASAFRQIYKSLDNDAVKSINSVNPSAAQGYVRANEIQRGIFELRDKLRPFIGTPGNEVTAEQAISRLSTDVARGSGADVSTLNALRKALPAVGFNEVRSFLFRDLGIKPDGSFDRSQFVQRFDRMTPEAKKVLFDVKPEQMQAINKVMNYARTIKPEVLNPSGTGGQVTDIAAASTGIGAIASGAVNPAVGIGLALIPRLVSQGLSSQTLAKAINSTAFRRAMSVKNLTQADAMSALQTGMREAGATNEEAAQIFNFNQHNQSLTPP